MRNVLLLLLVMVLATGCAVGTRARRVLGPDHYVFPDEAQGRHAQVLVHSGWQGEDFVPYAPHVAFEHEGERWLRPVVVNDRGQITVVPRHDGVGVSLYARGTGLSRRGFRPVIARTGTLAGHVPRAVRWLPSEPLSGVYTLDIADLQNPWSGDALRHGDLLLLELSSPGERTERYVFDARRFGFRTRLGAGLLVRVPLQVRDDQEAQASPALTVSLSLGYRFRTQDPVWEFIGERITIVGSAGVGSTVLESVSGPLDEQLQGAFDSLLLGGGLEFFDFVSVQLLANARAPFHRDVDYGWTLAAGFDAVQFGRFFANAGARLQREHPLREDR